MSATTTNPHSYTIAIATEAALLALVLAVCALLGVLRLLQVQTAALLCMMMVVGLIFAAWKRFDGGRHPAFLFLSMLFVFQCGALPGYWTGTPQDPFMNQGQSTYFTVSTASQELTLLLIALSASCVYVVSRLTYRPITFKAGIEQRWLRPLYMVLALTLPLAAYKNYLYLSFVRSHGGYLAIYTQSEELLQSAGIAVRTIALLGTTVLLMLYTFERRKRYVTGILLLVFAVSSMDLLIGLRGKFFVQLLLLWYIRNLKTGRKFNLVPLLSSALLVTVVAVLIAGFREDAEINLLGPLGFLATQGVSLNVTALAVENRARFQPRTIPYIWNEIILPIAPKSAAEPGNSFDNDLSYFVDPQAAAEGYGTGGSYLAESYIFGGVPGVIVASILLALVLSWLHNQSRTWFGALLLMNFMGGVIYLPRASLLSPFSSGIKSLMSVGIIAIIAFVLYEVEMLFLGGMRTATQRCMTVADNPASAEPAPLPSDRT